MKKHLLLTFLAAVLLAATLGSDPAQAQGQVLIVPPPT